MRMVDLIHQKRLSKVHSLAEIEYIIHGFNEGSIPDYQMSAWLMAVCVNGMNIDETSQLTMAMVRSGNVMDLSHIPGIKVDKHSTGGVGDKVSLIVAPLLATLGVPVAKMSGRGLGHTGGTIDKLESIPGFRTQLTEKEWLYALQQNHMAIISQTSNLVPADKKMYALRDVTATVDSIPLIASSIMSKKIAAGADAIVLDVKVGRGAFMKSIKQARALAQAMVDIGKQCNRRTVAVITDMQQPLGHEIGNANEIREAIQVLAGRGPTDLTEVSIVIASHMAVLGGAFATYDQANPALRKMIERGEALPTLRTFIELQGGNPDIVNHPDVWPSARYRVDVVASQSGYIQHIDAEQIGIAAMMLGAGRTHKEDTIDYTVGITLHAKVGHFVQIGQLLCTIHANQPNVKDVEFRVNNAYEYSNTQPAESSLIHDVISSS
jgi:pyrimidine-nucleoside phosphorylase